MITKYYKGRISFIEALEQPMGFLHYLYYSAIQEAKTDVGKANAQAQADEEALGI